MKRVVQTFLFWVFCLYQVSALTFSIRYKSTPNQTGAVTENQIANGNAAAGYPPAIVASLTGQPNWNNYSFVTVTNSYVWFWASQNVSSQGIGHAVANGGAYTIEFSSNYLYWGNDPSPPTPPASVTNHFFSLTWTNTSFLIKGYSLGIATNGVPWTNYVISVPPGTFYNFTMTNSAALTYVLTELTGGLGAGSTLSTGSDTAVTGTTNITAVVGSSTQLDPFTNAPLIPAYQPTAGTNQSRTAITGTDVVAALAAQNANQDARNKELIDRLLGIQNDQRALENAELAASAQQAQLIATIVTNTAGAQITAAGANTTIITNALGVGNTYVVNAFTNAAQAQIAAANLVGQMLSNKFNSDTVILATGLTNLNAAALTQNQLLTNLFVATTDETKTLATTLTNLLVQETSTAQALNSISNAIAGDTGPPVASENDLGVPPNLGEIPGRANSFYWPKTYSVPSAVAPVFTVDMSVLDSRMGNLTLDMGDTRIAAWVGTVRAFILLIITVSFTWSTYSMTSKIGNV